MRTIFNLLVVALLALAVTTHAEAGKRRKASRHSQKQTEAAKPAEPALAVGHECDLNKELGTRGGELSRIAAGATVRVTEVKRDDLTISTAAGTASLKRSDLLAACDKPPRPSASSPVAAAP